MKKKKQKLLEDTEIMIKFIIIITSGGEWTDERIEERRDQTNERTDRQMEGWRVTHKCMNEKKLLQALWSTDSLRDEISPAGLSLEPRVFCCDWWKLRSTLFSVSTLGDLIGRFLTWCSLSADRLPTVRMFCACTNNPMPRDQFVVNEGRTFSTGSLHWTRSGHMQSSPALGADGVLLVGPARFDGGEWTNVTMLLNYDEIVARHKRSYSPNQKILYL